MKELLLGYNVQAQPLQVFADHLYNSLFDPGLPEVAPRWLACINPHSYAVAKHDFEFSQALNSADWLIPDGAGILLASWIQSGKICQRITGSDVFASMHELMNQSAGLSVFFLGASQKTLAEICKRMARDYPNVRVAGTYSPAFKTAWTPDEQDAMVHAINSVQPDVLWVGMTAPKQEKWIQENLPRLNIRFAAAIGAVFDFYAGNVQRSHPAFQRLGLEWLPRLIQQPRRLWRRMFVSAPIFVWDVLKERLKQSCSTSSSSR